LSIFGDDYPDRSTGERMNLALTVAFWSSLMLRWASSTAILMVAPAVPPPCEADASPSSAMVT